MTAIIQADSFIETEDCNGPRYNRNSPSRETPGVILTDLQDKYITEFELPYRNIERYIKEVSNNWNRLNDNQRSLIKKSFNNMGLLQLLNTENFTQNSTNNNINTDNSLSKPIDPNVAAIIKHLANSPNSNTKDFMNTIWYTTPEQLNQLNVSSDQIKDIRKSINNWSTDNAYILHSNWKSGSLLFFFLILIIILIIIAASK